MGRRQVVPQVEACVDLHREPTAVARVLDHVDLEGSTQAEALRHFPAGLFELAILEELDARALAGLHGVGADLPSAERAEQRAVLVGKPVEGAESADVCGY